MGTAETNKKRIQKIAGLGALTAIVIVLQIVGSSIRLGPFSVSLVNVPLTIGAILYGVFGGVWLGFVFGMVVLISGDAAAFMTVNILGTIVTVLVKGMAAGAASAGIYQLLEGKNRTAATICAAIICPVVNTGLFLIGCLLFFMDTITGWAEAAGFSGNVAGYMILGLVGANFLAELAVSAVLTPVILRLLTVIRTRH